MSRSYVPPSGRAPWPVRVYAILLRLMPVAFRRAHGHDAADVFLDMYRDARRAGGRAAAAKVWVRAASRLVSCAIAARREERMERNGRGDTMGGMVQDLRFAFRSIGKRPGFALITIAILGIGIGATTTIFSLVDTVVLREMPYPHAGRLIHFANGSHGYPNFESWQSLSSFEAVVAARDGQVDLIWDGVPQRIPAVRVSRDFFGLLGAGPHLGRLFDQGDYPGDGSVTVLGHGAWQRIWGGDPSIVGRTIEVNGGPVTVIGVLSPAFSPPSIETGSRVDLWFALDNGGPEALDHGYHVLGVMGRLRPGTPLEVAQEEIDAERRAVAEEFPSYYVNRDGTTDMVPLVPLREATVGNVATTLWLLLGAVGLMLMIACGNVANLFLARGTDRAREIALRSALGAGRTRLFSLVLTETLVLALAGGLVGVGIAVMGVEGFLRWSPGGIPRIDGLSVDGRILSFSVLISVGTGLLFGLLPAVQATRSEVGEALKDGAAAVTSSRSGRRTRNVLVVSEVSLAMVLLIGAGLLFRTLVAIVDVDPGFETDRLAVVRLSLDASYDDAERVRFAEALAEDLEALPRVSSVAAGWSIPFRRTGNSRCCWRTSVGGEGAVIDEETPFNSIIHPITPRYFETLRAPLAYGREFTRADMKADDPVVILNRTTGRELFGEDNVVGRTITFGGDATVATVVGVVEGVHHWGLNQDVERAVYVPYGGFGGGAPFLDMMVRASSDAEGLATPIREAIWRLDATLPVAEVSTMERWVSSSVATPRFLSMLFGVFALVALALACAGIYGSMLYTVGQRRKELGIRLALGARGSEVTAMVIRYGVTVAGIGVAIGGAAAAGASRLMAALVWGVEPTDAVTFGIVAGVLSLAAVSACALPAWRAGRTDPLETLRTE